VGKRLIGRKLPDKWSKQQRSDLANRYARNEWREFVRETSAAKFYAIGFCVLSFGLALAFLTSFIFGDQRNWRFGNAILACGGYSALRKLKRWMIERGRSQIK
jgi:hypothetical protein